MNARDVLARLANLNVDFRYLDQFIVDSFKGAKVLVNYNGSDLWMSFGIFQGRLCLIDEEGVPNEYSDLDVIKTIHWPSAPVTREESKDLAEIGNKLHRLEELVDTHQKALETADACEKEYKETVESHLTLSQKIKKAQEEHRKIIDEGISVHGKAGTQGF